MTKTLGDISPNEFENLVFDLVQALGMKNCVWRTPGRDGGRDIQGECYIEDLSGYTGAQNWYVECKRYKSAVSWPNVWEKISYAESNSTDVLLVVVSSSLSPQAVDEVNKWNYQRKKLTIRFWNRVDVESRLRLFPTLSIKYGLSADPQRDKAAALLPIIKILLKYSDSSHAAEVFLSSSPRKLSVLYSLSEFVAARLSDIQKSDMILVHPFRKSKDTFEWLLGSECMEHLQVDRYAFRVLACYVKDFLKFDNIALNKVNDRIFIDAKRSIPDYVQDDLNQIALMSNMELNYQASVITIRVR